MSSYAERVAKLRPLASRAEVAKVYDDGERPPYPEAPWGGFSAWFGPKVGDAPIGAAAPDTLEVMKLDETFSSAVDFYGFSIGMSYDAAREMVTRLNLRRQAVREDLPDDVQSFAGTTPDGFEISLLFRGTLAEIKLYRSDFWSLFKVREAFCKARVEAEDRQRARMNAWKAITDNDDAMLMDWATHCRPWSDSTPSEFVKLAEWMLHANPDQRHVAACRCNWDYGLAPLLWISRRSDCDLATALYIFFGCDPAFYMKFDGERQRVDREASNVEAYNMMMEIKNRIDQGFYKRSAILFDAREHLAILDRYNPTPAQCAAVLPVNLRARYEGRRMDRDNRFGGLQIPEFLID